jgi:hypothetical protein
MAVVLDPVSDLPPVTRDVNFSNTISASGDAGETIISVTASLVGDPLEPTVSFNNTATSSTLSGQFKNGFTDIFQYVSKGSSTAIEIPTVVVGQENVPPDQDLFDLNQDKNQFINRTISVTVAYEDLGTPGTYTATLTQSVFNNLDAMKEFMGNYFK